MSTPQLSALLIEAPIGRHFAQLHSDSDTLARSVTRFIEMGLRRGSGVVVIASSPHVGLFEQRLNQTNLDLEACRRSGKLAILDAEAVLPRVMRGGMPDWPSFRRIVGGVLETVDASGRSATRAYGEMVNILWRQGRPEAAIRLEEYWSELARLYPFCLFCGYMLDSQEEASYAGPLHEIGRTHTDIIATDEDERFREALDAASRDVFGVPLAQLFSLSGHEEFPGEHRLPSGQRTMLWIMRHMPARSAEVLERARGYYHVPSTGVPPGGD